MTADPKQLAWSATWVGQKAQVTLTMGTKALFVDKCDPASSVSRDRMFSRLHQHFPAVERDPIEARLVSIAAEAPAEPAPTGASFTLPQNPPAWDTAVDGGALLDEIEALLLRHVVLPEHAAKAVALWIVHSYVVERFTYSPRLLVSSPEKRCGKSLLLRFVAALSSRPLPCENISTAALYRSIEKFAPTLLLDEADTFLAGRNPNEEMRGVINAGFARGGCVLRCVGDDLEPMQFQVFGALALGMIGKPQGTIEDRSVTVSMRRKVPGDVVQKLPAGRPLREFVGDTVKRIVRWAQDHGEELAGASPSVPTQLDDRAADCWFALLAIADAAGASWPQEARRAAVALSSGRDAPGSQALLLLADLRSIFATQSTDRLRTQLILDQLVQMDDRPWPDYRNGKAVNASQVARLLEPFGVRPDKWKAGDTTERGYLVGSFADAWSRYLPADGGAATPPPAAGIAASAGARPLDRCRHAPPPAGAVADGGGEVTADGGAASAVDAPRWRQVADEAPSARSSHCDCATDPDSQAESEEAPW